MRVQFFCRYIVHGNVCEGALGTLGERAAMWGVRQQSSMLAGLVGHEIRRRDSDVIVGLEEIQHRAVDGTEGYDEMTWWLLWYLEGPV